MTIHGTKGKPSLETNKQKKPMVLYMCVYM